MRAQVRFILDLLLSRDQKILMRHHKYSSINLGESSSSGQLENTIRPSEAQNLTNLDFSDERTNQKLLEGIFLIRSKLPVELKLRRALIS